MERGFLLMYKVRNLRIYKVKNFEMGRLSWITGWVLDAIISVLVRERQGEICPRDRRGGGSVTERQRLE